MTGNDELWIPLVDEPIGSIVQQIIDENPEIARLVESPRRILAFRTFAYIFRPRRPRLRRLRQLDRDALEEPGAP